MEWDERWPFFVEAQQLSRFLNLPEALCHTGATVYVNGWPGVAVAANA